MWTFQGEQVNELPLDCEGFVYLITNLTNNKKYIGKKLARFKVTKPPLKGRKNKRRSIAESDWKSYVGSSTSLQKIVEDRGTGALQRREILHLCRTRGDGNYLEAKEQFDRGVLFRDDFHNQIINLRTNSKDISDELKERLRKMTK